MTINVETHKIYTKLGVAVSVSGVAQVSLLVTATAQHTGWGGGGGGGYIGVLPAVYWLARVVVSVLGVDVYSSLYRHTIRSTFSVLVIL